jgi:hypothetical protein
MRCAILALGLTLLALVSACDTCPYRSVNSFTNADDTNQTLGCCDAQMSFEFLNAYDDADVDILVVEVAGAATQVTAWLTRNTCERLFDTGSSVPRCEILIGPVQAGTTSQKTRVPSGRLRVWVQQRNPVQTQVRYVVSVALWRHSCSTLSRLIEDSEVFVLAARAE